MKIDNLKKELFKNIEQNKIFISDASTGLTIVNSTIKKIDADLLNVAVNTDEVKQHSFDNQNCDTVIAKLAGDLPSSEVIEIIGTSSLLNIEQQGIAVYFIPIDNNIEFFIVIDLPPSWKLSDSFPNITEYLIQSKSDSGKIPLISLKETPPFFINEIQPDNSKFILSSCHCSDRENNYILNKGLNFKADCKIIESDTGFLREVDVFTGGLQWPVTGTVEYSQDEHNYPQLNIIAALPWREDNLQDKDSTFQFKTIWLRLFSEVSKNGYSYLNSGVSLGCGITVGNIELNLESELIESKTDKLRLHGKFDGLNVPSLSELSTFFGGDDLTGLLPENFIELPSLEIKNCDIAIPLGEPTIEYFRIVASLTTQDISSSWVLIDPWLKVEKIFFELEAFSLFNQEEREIVFTVCGEIILAGAEINVWMTAPEFQISGYLSKGKGIPIGTLTNEIANSSGMDISIPKSVKSLAVEDLIFYAHPADSYYNFGINLSGDYSINLIGDLHLKLNEIELKLALNDGAPDAKMSAFFNFADANFYVSASISAEEEALSFSGGLLEDNEINFNQLIAQLYLAAFPGSLMPKFHGLPELTFGDVNFALNTNGELHFRSTSSVQSTIPIRGKDCSLSLGLVINYDPEIKDDKLTGSLKGSLKLGNVIFASEFNLGDPALSLKLDQGSTLNFKEVGEFLLGEDLFDALPEDLINNLAGIEIDKFESDLDFENKDISLGISTTLKNITLGTDDLLIEKANLTLKLVVSESKQYCLIDIGGAGQIGPAVIFENCRFKFELDRKDGETDWSLGGSFDAEILGHDMHLEAGFKDVAGTKTLALLARDPFPAIEFPGVGSFELDEFKLLVEKKENQKASFALSTTFQLETEADIFELRSGTVALINEADRTGLKLFADGIDMKFPSLPHLPWFTLDEPLLDLTYNKKSKQWSCHGKTGFFSHNVPDMMKLVFPVEKLEAECTINDKKAEFLVRLEDGLIRIPAPVDVGDFGYAYIGVNEMKINLMHGASLTAKLSFGLPVGLNAIFQPTAEDGARDKQDKLEIFRVYDPDAKEELIGLDLTISTERGLICELDQSPFKFFTIEEDEANRKIIDIDLKEFGQIAVFVPVFSLQPDGSFSASGGFDVKRDLQFPLTPFKYLFRKIGLEAVSAMLPNGIPIKGIQFCSEKEGFQSDAFFELFVPDADQVPLPAWLREGFDAVDDILNRLPGDFLSYGNIEVPRHLNFDVDFSPSGSLKFQFSVKDPMAEEKSVPLKFLLPSFPKFTGIELYSIAFGELFGGALLRLDLDVKIDTFDLPSLLAALLIPYGELPKELKTLLPDPRKIQNSLRAQNLVTLIIYQTALPIPIPLFYDELSMTYKGLEGFELKSMFSFKKPTFDLASFGILLGELSGFFTKGKDIDLVKLNKVTLGDYTIGPNYIRFPKYVSTEDKDPSVGKLLGTEDGFTIKPVKFLGALLNSIKNLSINDLIQVVEVERRVGEIDLTIFTVLNINVQYALTTPFEFVDYAYKKLLGLDQNKARQFISILPPKRTGIPATVDAEYTYSPVTEDSEGLIIFLKGGLNVANALVFKTGFGLAATGGGFGLGMQFDGRLTKIFAVHMKGLVAIRKDGKFLLEGDSYLRILEQNILSGRFNFSNEGFQIEAQAGNGPVRVQGLLEGEFTNDIFRLEGRASLVFFGLTADGAAKFLFTDTEKLIYLHGKVELGDFIRLEAEFKSYADLKQAGMALSMKGNLSTLLDMSLEGAAVVKANGLLQAKGSASMKVLTHEVIGAKFEYINNVLSFNGHLDLFPKNKLMIVKGDVAGILSDDRFELSGECTIIIVGCKFVGATVLISDKEFLFTSQLFNQKSLLMMKRSDSGFTLYGTMSPIVIGKILKISCTDDAVPIGLYDLGGPSIFISTSAESPGFRLNGKVSILGIESATDILFNEKGFYFKVSGRLFNLIQGSFTAIGKDFNDSKNILIKGEIKTGDLQGATIAMINHIAKDVDKQIKNFNKSLEEKKRYLSEQQRKVNSLNSEINKCKAQINRLKKQISDKKAWYNRARWYEKPVRLVVLGVFVTAKGAEIAAWYAKIGILEGAKLTALGALEIAKAALSATQKVMESARAVSNQLAGFSVAVLKAAGEILTIRSASFETELSSICAGSTTMSFDVRFLGKDYKLENIRYNFFQPQVAVKSIVDALTKK